MSFRHLENIYARRVPLNYVSPPICEGDFSGTGEPVIILSSLTKKKSPTGVIFGGIGRFRLSWDNYPGAICFSVYKLVDELDPFGAFTLIAECISDNFLQLGACEFGTYFVTVITGDGESDPSDSIVIPDPSGGIPVNIVTESLPNAQLLADYSEFIIAEGGCTEENT